MPVFIDQTERELSFNKLPQRIVSLVPSQTELLYDLGLNESVVAITKFCIHPNDWFQRKKRIGGTKALDINTIRSLQPDLIIANKEENAKEQVEELASDYPVWTSDIPNLGEALSMIKSIGEMTGTANAATSITQKVKDGFASLHSNKNKFTAAYLIWQEPYMSVGGDTFIHDMLGRAGFENIFAKLQRYPLLTIEDLKRANPEYLLLSSEPFPFNKKHQLLLQQQLPSTKVVLVNGEMFSWYGSRLLLAPAYFKSLEIADC